MQYSLPIIQYLCNIYIYILAIYLWPKNWIFYFQKYVSKSDFVLCFYQRIFMISEFEIQFAEFMRRSGPGSEAKFKEFESRLEAIQTWDAGQTWLVQLKILISISRFDPVRNLNRYIIGGSAAWFKFIKFVTSGWFYLLHLIEKVITRWGKCFSCGSGCCSCCCSRRCCCCCCCCGCCRCCWF